MALRESHTLESRALLLGERFRRSFTTRSLLVVTALLFCQHSRVLSPCSRVQADESLDTLFLSADGPLWLRFQLSGVGLDEVRQRYIKALLRTVDVDGDGFADPDEAARLPKRGMPRDRKRLDDDWKSFDVDPQDGRLSATELIKLVEPGFGERFETRRKAPLLFQSVQLTSRLDRDADGQISATEIEDGPTTLRAFDFDDDGTLSPAELQPFPQAMVDAARVAQQDRAVETPFLIMGDAADIPQAASTIRELYGDENGVPAERSGVSEFAFKALDVNADGRLDTEELATMLDRPRPAAIIRVSLSAGRVVLDRPQRMTKTIEKLPVDVESRLAMRLGNEVVEFSAADNRYEASDQINLVRIRFRQADLDKNGSLGRDEFISLPNLGLSFEELDNDGDGQLFLKELDSFLRLDSYLSQCAIELEVEAVEKPLFRILDADMDRRLTAREFAGGIERMQEYDVNGDGRLDERELQVLRKYRVRFSFAEPPALQTDTGSQMMANSRMPIINRSAVSGPRWFQKMDRNADGDLTWREFLGPRSAFDNLDSDSSGWIDASEAERVSSR